MAEFASNGLTEDGLSISLVEISEDTSAAGSFRGDVSCYLVARAAIPGGADIVLAVFTKGVKTAPGVIPRVFEKVGARYAREDRPALSR